MSDQPIGNIPSDMEDAIAVLLRGMRRLGAGAMCRGVNADPGQPAVIFFVRALSPESAGLLRDDLMAMLADMPHWSPVIVGATTVQPLPGDSVSNPVINALRALADAYGDCDRNKLIQDLSLLVLYNRPHNEGVPRDELQKIVAGLDANFMNLSLMGELVKLNVSVHADEAGALSWSLTEKGRAEARAVVVSAIGEEATREMEQSRESSPPAEGGA